MNHLKLIGIKNDQYNFFKNEILKALPLLNGSFHLEEVNALDAIMGLELESIPVLLVNDKIVITVNGFLPNVNEIIFKIKKATTPISCSNTIIIPIDFSNNSKNAFIFGQNIALTCGQAIHMVHITKPSFGIKMGFINPIGIKEKNMRLFIEQNTVYPNLEISSEIVAGQVIPEIINIAQHKVTDFIVMGTTGRSNKKQFLGSISRKLSLNDAFPSFLIPHACAFHPFTKIVFAAKHTTENQNLAKSLAETMLFNHAVFSMVEVDVQSNTNYKEIKKNHVDGYTKILLQDDSVVAALVKFIDQNDVDLLIMYKPSQPFWQSVFHKSKTKKMHKEIKIPLLLLH